MLRVRSPWAGCTAQARCARHDLTATPCIIEPERYSRMAMADRPEAPKWFTDAFAAPRRERFVEVEGCRIRYLSWGDASKPGLVLVHGGAAHAELVELPRAAARVAVLRRRARAERPRRQRAPRGVSARGLGSRGHGRRERAAIVGAADRSSATASAASSASSPRRSTATGSRARSSSTRRCAGPIPRARKARAGRAFRNPKTYPTSRPRSRISI